MASKHQQLRLLLTDAIVELCRKEAFYVEELRIEGTVCLVSDRSSVLIAQITEQIGDQFGGTTDGNSKLPVLNSDQAEELGKTGSGPQGQRASSEGQANTGSDSNNDDHQKGGGSASTVKRTSPQAPINRGEKKYQCPFCPKSYNFKHSLKDHINKHTGRKPHVCKHCSMSFTHFGSLCAHIKRQHYHQLSVDFQCSICQERFMNDQSLKQHFTWRHKDVPYMSSAKSQSRMLEGHGQTQDVKEMKDTAMEVDGDVSGDRADIKQEPAEGSGRGHDDKDETKLDGSSHDAKDRKTTEGVTDIVQTFIRMLEGERNSEQQRQQLEQQQQLLQQHQQQQKQAQMAATSFPVSKTNSTMVQAVTPSQWETVTSLSSLGLPGFPGPSTSAGAGVIPGASNPTLEMLAHMAQMTQGAITHGLNPLTTLSQHAPLGFHPMMTAPPQMRAKPPQDFQRSPDGKFQCPYCEKTYNFKHTLKDHINKHLGNRPHVCKHCGDSFTHLASLCAHIKRRHDNQMTTDYQCELCHEKFMNLQSLKQHFTWRHKDVKFSPRKFLESSKGAIPLNADADAATPDPPTQSLHGNISTNSLPQQVNIQPAAQSVSHDHPVSHDPLIYNQSQTEQPGEQGLSDNHLTASQVQHHLALNDPMRQPQFPGIVPGFSPPPSFPIPSPEEELLLPPDDDDDTPPSIYIAEYFSEVNLQTQHGFYKYKCKICGNMFKIRNSLYEHLNSHLGKKPYICSHCGDAFTHHSTLHNHVRNKHSFQSREEREAQFKHLCEGCGKKFRYPSELERHLKSNPDHEGPGKTKVLPDTAVPQ